MLDTFYKASKKKGRGALDSDKLEYEPKSYKKNKMLGKV